MLRLLLLLAGAVAAQAVHKVPFYADTIRIDGVLDEPGWRSSDSLLLVTNHGPGGARPKAATSVKVLWSQAWLYAAFWAETPNVEGTITRHDGPLYTQDVVEMFIDPDGDSQNYLELNFNCLNTSLDWRYARVRQGSDTSWAPKMRHAVKVRGTANRASDEDTGMLVEIAIPWADLKPWSKAALPPGLGDRLPVNFYRIDYPAGGGAEEFTAWSPTGAEDFHRPDKFGRLEFVSATASLAPLLRGPSSGRRWRFGPAAPEESVPILAVDGRRGWKWKGARQVPGALLKGP